MDLGLNERVYIVTGATRGLGRASAEALVADGARVVVSSRSEESVRATVDALGPSSAHGLALDNADPDTPSQLVETALSRFGRLDGALVSVGGPPAGSVLDVSDDAWRAAFDSVFLGAVRLGRTIGTAISGAARSPERGTSGGAERDQASGGAERDQQPSDSPSRDGGALAFVLSSSVRSPIAGLAVSNGLRPGLAMVVKQLADELGPNGVRAVGLLPGSVETDRLRELAVAAGRDPDEAKAAASATIPLRRYGRPEEFGRVAAFVLSPAASYLTGLMIPVDGGALRTL